MFDIVSDDYYLKLLHEERIRWEAIEKAVEFFPPPCKGYAGHRV